MVNFGEGIFEKFLSRCVVAAAVVVVVVVVVVVAVAVVYFRGGTEKKRSCKTPKNSNFSEVVGILAHLLRMVMETQYYAFRR